MKKLIPFALSLTLFVLILSCGSGGGGGVVTPATPKAEVNISILPSNSVNFGDKINVVVSIKYADSGTLKTDKGQTFQVVNNETKEFQLTENTTFSLEASNADGIKATTSKAVSVGSWKDNNLGLLNHQGKHWVRGDVQIIQNGELLIIYHPDENQIGEYYIYNINGTVGFYDKDDNIYWTPEDYRWKFLENETKIQYSFSTGTDTYTIEKLTETELSLSQVIDYGGEPATVVENFTIEE